QLCSPPGLTSPLAPQRHCTKLLHPSSAAQRARVLAQPLRRQAAQASDLSGSDRLSVSSSASGTIGTAAGLAAGSRSAAGSTSAETSVAVAGAGSLGAS